MNEERRVSGPILWRAGLLVLAGVVLYVAYQAERPLASPDAPVDLARALWYLACSGALVGVLALFAGRGRPSWSLSETAWLRLVLLIGLAFLAVGGIAAVRRTGGAPDVVAVAALGLGLLLLPLWRPTGGRVLLAGLLAGVALRLALLPHTPLDAAQADMLPLIQAAGQRLLQGQSPYGLYAFHEWPLPLTYLPVTWLAYLPAVAGGADPRLINVAASAGAVAILWSAVRRSPAAPLAGVLFLLPQLVAFDLYAEVAVFWLVLAAFLACLVRERYGGAAAGYGLALATSPLALVFLPLLFVFLLRRLPARRLAGAMLLAAGVTTALVLPFLLWSPAEFLYGTVTWFNDPTIAGAGGWLDRNQLYQVGLAGWFWLGGWVAGLRPIQAGLVVLATAVLWGRGRGWGALLLTMLGAYVGFLYFNLIIWPYLYAPLLWLGFLVLTKDE